ncbi:MAG: hypothetical protein ONB48_10955 [candidate division KSB1 bacterium]|nr:hypothetical protein [candidate division KSB1 bacterium]MDZ7275527.1 hypothetical protein [candidate division KSB1 bacterium]MDZ7286161.1 hypothetical protein [candidate division KSB1 bacterium]MDZ7296387.1 hypothetical protein [candidate division KSB1 bacterium]MDZ7306222.1 hypothetical protein [candidate division KSB1 bacterium]
MKRLIVFVAAALALLLVGLAVLKSEARTPSSTQFYGKAIHMNGEPAEQDTEVTAWLGGVMIGKGVVWDTRGNFYIGGDNSAFPTGTYSIHADDGHWTGSVSAYHIQGTATHTDDIIMVPY